MAKLSKKSNKNNPLGMSDYLLNWLYEQQVESWQQRLDGYQDDSLFIPQTKEVYFATLDEEEVKKVVAMFEQKYNRKLKYRQIPPSSLYYISYVETEVGDKYDRTVLNKNQMP